MKKRKPARLWAFRPWQIVLMTLPFAAVATLHVSMVPLYAGLKLAGRAGDCPLPNAIDAERNLRRLKATADDILAQSQWAKDGSLIRWKTPHGEFWAPPGTHVPLLLAKQLHGFYGQADRRVRTGDIVLDCGAGVGAFTWEALRAGARLVIAVESSEQNLESLRRTFATEIQKKRVIVYPGTLGANETSTTTTIDRIVEIRRLRRIDFIKMDLGGAERSALRGGRITMISFRPRMAVATRSLPDDPDVIPEVIYKIRPEYHHECGRCAVRSALEIQPDILYFR